MGRGRAKAKQTKVARDLKYRSIETDFSQLQRELHGDEASDGAPDGASDGASDGVSDGKRGTDDERADEESPAR